MGLQVPDIRQSFKCEPKMTIVRLQTNRFHMTYINLGCNQILSAQYAASQVGHTGSTKREGQLNNGHDQRHRSPKYFP